MKSQLIISLMLGKIEGKRELDDRGGGHHQIDGLEFEQAPGVGDGQGSLVHCSPWGHRPTKKQVRVQA